MVVASAARQCTAGVPNPRLGRKAPCAELDGGNCHDASLICHRSRPRAQAALEVAIAVAEAKQQKLIETVAQLKAAGRQVRREEAMLQLATRKLSRLRSSQAVLATGEDGEWQS